MYNLLRTLLSAFSAARTFLIINMCNIIFNRDGTVLALFGTKHTADTPCLTGRHDILALVF